MGTFYLGRGKLIYDKLINFLSIMQLVQCANWYRAIVLSMMQLHNVLINNFSFTGILCNSFVLIDTLPNMDICYF